MPATSGSSTSARHDLGLALLRLIAGAVFIVHGGQKLFVLGFAGTTAMMAQLGAPLPGVTGPLIGLLEFFGGIALVIGLLTRLAGLGLALDMLGAIVIYHAANGFFVPRGVEFVMVLGTAAAALALMGAGRYSVDGMLARRFAGYDGLA